VEHRGRVEDLRIELEPVVSGELDTPGVDPDRVVHEPWSGDVRDEPACSLREHGIRNDYVERGERLVRHLGRGF